MSLTTRCLHNLRQPSRAAIGLTISSHRLSRSIPCSSFNTTLGQRRAFSLSSILETSQSLILDLHHVTGTPWYITIPMVAVGVAAVFRLPFQIHSQKLLIQRQQFQSLINAWNAKHLREIVRDLKDGRLSKSGSIQLALKRSRKEENRIFAKAGLQRWKLFLSVLAMPAWLTAIDSVRRLCGGPVGLIGQFAMGEKSVAADLERQAVGLPPSDNSNVSGAAMDADISATASSTVDGVTSIFEPSLVTEGCLWFTDLTAADPYHVLPFALSAVLVANAWPRTESGVRDLFSLGPKLSAAGEKQVHNTTPFRRSMSRLVLLLSAAIGPLTMNMPAAIHLYWLTSACTSSAMRYLVGKRWPLPKDMMVKPCKSIEESPLIKPRGKLD